MTIDLRGDPVAVEHTKGMLESLSNEIFFKDIKLSPKPGLKQVIDNNVVSMRHEIQKKHDAVVEIELTEPPQVRGRQARLRSNSLIKASTSGGVRVKVVTGEFASEQTDVLVSFVTETPDFHSPVLSTLIKVGGDEVRHSLQQLPKERLLHGTAHSCSHGRLPCSLLVHIVVPTYSTSSSTFTNVLSEALPQIVQFTSGYRKISITPLTAFPFNCPVDLYAEKVLEALDSMSDDTDVSVYVENSSCKQVFEERMKTNKYYIFPPMPVGLKTTGNSPAANADLNSSLQKAVKIIKASILEVKVGNLRMLYCIRIRFNFMGSLG